ncbi:HNH endonuclease signature motif containing protein [Mycolicibacterium neoaurum]|uniref:HNH endonuclease signature motif containing protein n=1 Tax=Mycolicibacterium neoaurum TaxID=1795 RepID=UPI001F16AC7A|nr:HNH endonuclease signature motif containing protein [Mycolicibacterium neoaurum]
MIEHQFEGPGMVVADHLDAARGQLLAERTAVAAKVLAAGRFALARMAELGHGFDDLIVDDWELVAAELGAELGISRGRACTLITQGRDLLTRLPVFAQVFAGGGVDLRVLRVILHRCALITDPDITAIIDTQLAAAAPSWNALSDERIAELIDWMIIEIDPVAVRRARETRRRRHLNVEPVGDGMVEIHGLVDAAKGAIFDQSVQALARTVCPHDPRTHAPRRADALDALALRATSIACLCGRQDCPAAGNEVPSGQFIVHVLTEQDSITAAAGRGAAESHAPVGDKTSAQAQPTTTPRPALIPGYGPITVEQLADLLLAARIRPVPDATALGIEPGYHPSRGLADFVGCRDLTCRWPGCTMAVGHCDIDHTTPWPYGPTHPSNTKLYCRIHHLIKTFHCGPGGWNDTQHPDGTLTLTAPNGRVYTTKPDGALFFPQFTVATADLGTIDIPPPTPGRERAAPKRSRTRAQNRAYRIAHERAHNRAHIDAHPPPF